MRARAFIAGLTERSLLSAGSALLTVALGAAALFIGVDEEFAATHLRLFDGRGKGAAVQTTATLVGLRVRPPEEPQVLVLGSSAVRNSVDLVHLEGELAGRTPTPVGVLGFCSGAQPLPISHGIVENLPAGVRGVVLLGVGLRQLADTPETDRALGSRPRLGIRADVIDAAVLAAGGTPPHRSRHCYAWDNRTFIVPRVMRNLPRNLVHGVAPYVAMPQRGRTPFPPEIRERALDRAQERLSGYAEHVDRNTARLDALVADVGARPGLSLVLLESPVNPALAQRPSIARMRADFIRRLEDIATRRGVTLLRLDAAAELGADDFLDAMHLRTPESSGRFTRALADALTTEFEGR